ncbi:MAG: hypothetical protein HXS48_12345 [Theionarchaea archaeon]|nr:MAG: hypothetical protein AYK19_19245 [Theionarchaea archaeon DG-70-1]MBU7027717.1 hypothetical protein [Theionarchaea archaeon]
MNPDELPATHKTHIILQVKRSNFDIIWDELGKDVPVIGLNTYGEQGSTSGGALGHHNQTSSILVIGNELVSQ